MSSDRRSIPVDTDFSLSKILVVSNLFFEFRRIDVDGIGAIPIEDVSTLLHNVFASNTMRIESAIRSSLPPAGDRVSFSSLIAGPLGVLISIELWGYRKDDEFERAMNFLRRLWDTTSKVGLDFDLFDLSSFVNETFPMESDNARRELFQFLVRISSGDQEHDHDQSKSMQLSNILSESRNTGTTSRPTSAMVGRFGSSLATRYVARCLNDTPFLLSNDTTYYDTQAVEQSEGTKLFRKAEASVTRATGLSCAWLDAAEEFKRAAVVLKDEYRLPDAANAWIRGSDCLRALGSVTEEAAYLIEAGNCLRACGLHDDAIHCFTDVVSLYEGENLKGKVARYTKILAEVNAEAGDALAAADAFQLAADYFEQLGLNSDCRGCLQYAAVILVENGFATEAIQVFERLANTEVDQCYWYFRSMLCYIGTIDAEDGVRHLDGIERARLAFEMYTDVCVSFQSGVENQAVRKLIDYTLKSDPESVRKAVEDYVQRRTLEPWVEAMLHRIISNVHKKHRAIEAMMLF